MKRVRAPVMWLLLCAALALPEELRADDAGTSGARQEIDAGVPLEQDADGGVTVQLEPDSAVAAPNSAITAVPLGVHRKKKKKRKLKRRVVRSDGFHLATKASALGGALSGYRVRKGDAAVARLDAEIEPSVVVDRLAVALPLGAGHRETFGVHLAQSHAEAALEARYRILPALRVAGRAGVGIRDRPNWPDLYQPTGTSYARTDRYSYWSRQAGAGVTVLPGRRHWLRGSYAYRLVDYTTDPHFDPVGHPNHLTPLDSEKHLAEISYSYAAPPYRLAIDAEAFIRNAFFVFARDAGTGFTHAGPGGRPPNPLQSTRGVTPGVEFTLKLLQQRLRLSLRYAHEFQEDTFQGYYSFSGPNPSLDVRYRLGSAELRARMELWWRRYGHNSYRQGLGHPPLDSGDRRFSHRLRASLGARIALSKTLALTFDGDYTIRNTNFPDYEPGVFPASQRYAIDWDYTNLLILAGVEVRAGL